MRKNPNSVDGFVPRRSAGSLGEHHEKSSTEPPQGFQQTERPQLGQPTRPFDAKDGQQRPVGQVSKAEIDESLAGIDDEEPVKKRRFGFLRQKQRKPKVQTRKKKIIKRVLIVLAVILVILGAIMAIRAIIAGGKIFQGNLFGLFTSQPLKMDENGRSNILVFGTSEDDPNHQAPYLTDSIMVVSIDQRNKNAYMMSIPRDLWVQYGKACISGYEGKINEVYGCNSNLGKNEKPGANALRKKVGNILGLDVQYYAHVNYTVVRDVVKALDGIRVKIESRNPNGILDSNFDWKCKGGDKYASLETMKRICPPDGHYIQYPNGWVNLDAEHALYLAQARGDRAPTYGLERSNFDREVNQQKIVKAIREKALSAGTLTNFGKVTGLMDALGNNLRTNFVAGEVRTLISLGQDIPAEEIKSISFVEEGNELMVGANFSGAVVPAAGTFDYSQIQAYLDQKLSKDPVVREAAKIVVLNGTDTVGLAQKEADALDAKSYRIILTSNSTTNVEKTRLYQLKKGYSGTRTALEKYYGVTTVMSKPDTAVPKGTVFVVVVGSDRVNPEE